MELDIYGQVKNVKGRREDCPFRYPGQYEDCETGLYYNRFRYYDPEVGGYVSQDPIGLLGGNRQYTYVIDTCKLHDPFGLMPWVCPVRQGHHLVYRNKAQSIGLDHLASETDTPTFFFNKDTYVPGSHERIHRAQRPHVGPRQGLWTGTAEELIDASKRGLSEVDDVIGDLKIPSTGEILAQNVNPRQAFEKLEEWHNNQMKKKGLGCK